jgi:N,N'-diacetyllegionaminate synthase
LEEVGVKRYKIGSGEVTNFLMLQKIAQTGKPILLSSGMSSFEELDQTLAFLQPFGNELSIFQCTTAYPTQPNEWGLNVLQDLKTRYQLPVGFSDHSGDVHACLAAAALGAELFEFHVVFDKRQFGPDTPASITIDQTAQLVKGIRNIQTALQHPIDKTDNTRFQPLKTIFEKSLAVNKALPAGHILRFEDLEAKKPGDKGIPARYFGEVIGKKLAVGLEQWAFLEEGHLTTGDTGFTV